MFKCSKWVAQNVIKMHLIDNRFTVYINDVSITLRPWYGTKTTHFFYKTHQRLQCMLSHSLFLSSSLSCGEPCAVRVVRNVTCTPLRQHGLALILTLIRFIIKCGMKLFIPSQSSSQQLTLHQGSTENPLWWRPLQGQTLSGFIQIHTRQGHEFMKLLM